MTALRRLPVAPRATSTDHRAIGAPRAPRRPPRRARRAPTIARNAHRPPRDRHGLREAYGGWTMLKMRSLSVKNVLEAIRTAACYASAGPTIHDFRVEDGQVKLTCSPAIRVVFKGTNDSWIKRHAKAGRAIRGATADLPDEKWPFIRAVVTDDKGQKAWTNPIRV